MKKRENNPPIIYSAQVEGILQFFNDCYAKYRECKEYMNKANDETQDILHTMELCTCTVQERNKLFNKISEIRRQRRIAKDEEAVLNPIIEWCNSHESELKSLKKLLDIIYKIEESTNGERYYRNRTDVILELFGEASILDIPADKTPDTTQSSDEINEVSVNARIIAPETYDGNPESEIREGRKETILRYPVVIYHTKKKRSGTYYYVFPGVESPVIPHAFNSGDPVMNIKNKKLMNDIAVQFNEVMLRHRKEIPFPISSEMVNPSQIKNSLHIGTITEARVIYQEYRCYCKEENMGETNPAL